MTRQPRDFIGRIFRMEEEIRQLRLRPVGAAGPSRSLHDYLLPGYQGSDSGNIDTDDTAARYYLAGERVYLGGTVILTRADIGAHQDYQIAGPLPFTTPRELSIGHAFENQSLSNTGWISRSFGAYLASIYVLSGGPDDQIPDGTAISLDSISYRVTA